MARLVTIGYETNSVTAEWTNNTTTAIQTATIRSGKYAGEASASNLSAGTPVGWTKQFVTVAANGPYFLRFYYLISVAPNSSNYIATFSSSATLATIGNGCFLQLNTDRSLTLIDNGTISSGSSSALNLNQWYRIEMNIDNGAVVCSALLEGTQFGSSSAVGGTAAVLAFKLGGNLDNAFNTAGDWFFDDIALNDSTGSTNNSFPGEMPALLAKQNYPTLRPRAFAPGIAR